MNIIIASDIHGSAACCTKFVKACYLEDAKSILLLGDILDGDRETAALLNSLNREKSIFCVRGNCDYPEDQEMLEFPIMAEYCLLIVQNRIIYASHGRKLIPNIQKDSIFLHGHTHVPTWTRSKFGYFDLCPGSVSEPRQNSENSYMILNDEGFFWKNLDGRTYHSESFSENQNGLFTLE